MKVKVPKNEDTNAPLGHKEWVGRTSRWRTSWFLSKFLILKEVMEDYFNRHPETRNTQEYSDLYDEICGIVQKMQTPLTTIVDESNLF